MVLVLYLLQVFIAKEVISVSGASTISVPNDGNCGDDTVLTCHVTGSIKNFTGWVGLSRSLVVNGVPVLPEDNNKYTEIKGTSSFTLTIHNTDITDEGMYGCKNGFSDSMQKSLKIECKASSAVLTVPNSKKVVITVDKLYPASPTLAVSFKKENSVITVPESRTCHSSTQYTGYYRCVWSSSNSLLEGSYTYSLVVTTTTQADPLTGSFKIVSPQTPILSNVNEGEDRLYANEGQAVTIQCISRGGYPVPTVALYKDTISSGTQLASISTGTLQSDNTYFVTLQHVFTPSASDDRKPLICRSYYPQADSAYIDSKTKSVVLYLNLKPSQPTVTQTSVVSTGDTVEITCRTTGCRPVANISWLYQGSKTTGVVSSTLDAATETFTVVSVFRRKVTAADNGQSVQCIVTHPALINPSQKTATLNLNVRFPVGASSTKITGNKEMVATGNTPLTLTCTTGSSNPASVITWKNDSVILTSNRPYINSTGENNGVVRSQQLVLHPTRYMDGDVITCTVSNEVSQSDVVDDTTLNLKYSPLVTIQDNPQTTTVTEGGSKQLSCSVNSKPPSTITWYQGNSVIQQGTPVNNVLNYNLTSVNRTHAGTYKCKANNGIGQEQAEHISVIVRFKSLTTTINGNSTIIANGRNTLSLLCTTGSSNPISDITWRINNVITASTETLTDISGDYGGMKRRHRLILTPTRANDGDDISCEASNSIGTSERSQVTLDLRYRPMINFMNDITAVEGNYTILTCSASSKPASTFTWYKEGQSSSLKEGTGTLENNKLTYTINNVRRTDAAKYRCEANNGIETADSKNVNLTVNFPPVVTVDASNTTIKETSAILTCNAAGLPNKNYQYGYWIHTWPGYPSPVSENPGNKKLELKGLTYEHSGVYTCSASNGIKVFGTNKEFMEGSVNLLVESFPIITHLDEKFPAKLEENATVEVYFYSNAEASDVKIEIERNGSKPDSLKYFVSTTPAQVDLKVFTHNIKTDGIRAQILIQLRSKEDLGHYNCVVSNAIDSSKRSFEIVPQGPPFKPYNVSVFDIHHDKVSLSWIRGYHGGFAQTFVIQYSIDLDNWKNVTFDGDKDESEEPITGLVSGLQASTMYYVRMYAFNEKGDSTYTETLNYTTSSSPDEGSGASSSAIIGGAAGGGSAIVLIVVVVVVVVFLKRRGYLTKGKSPADDCKSDRRPVYTDENEYGMQDNPMYETAGPRNAGHTVGASGSGDMGAVYSTVDKKKLVETNKNDVYAEVDKSKKTKANTDVEYSSPVKPKGKDKKEKTKHGFMKDKKGKKAAKEGDLYENANELKGVATTKKNDETIYENPEPSKAGKKKNVNKDGLIYADLTFNDQPKGQKKLVIHGLDSMTEYVEVDFTKKADPLPDSDDENNSTTK